MIAYIEWSWLKRLSKTVLYRYRLPNEGFHCLHDAGMWVSRSAATPAEVQQISSLPTALDDAKVELRIVPTLGPLRKLGSTSLHMSAIRLRNSNRELNDAI